MCKRIAHRTEARPHIAGELFGRQRRAGVEHSPVGPPVEVVEMAYLFWCHGTNPPAEILPYCAVGMLWLRLPPRRAVRLLIRWELPLLHIAAAFRGGLGDPLSHLRVAPREFRGVAEAHPHEVVEHEDLAVAVRPRADADRRNPQFCSDACGHLARNGFEHYGERARGLDGARVAQQLLGALLGLTLHA